MNKGLARARQVVVGSLSVAGSVSVPVRGRGLTSSARPASPTDMPGRGDRGQRTPRVVRMAFQPVWLKPARPALVSVRVRDPTETGPGRAGRLRECRNRYREMADIRVNGASYSPASEPYGGHHHRCILDRRHPRRRHLVRGISLDLEAARGGPHRDLVPSRDGLARAHDRRPLRPPHGDDLLRPLRRLGRPQRPVREGHRGPVRLGDRGAAAARHRPAG